MEKYETDNFVNPIIGHLQENVPDGMWEHVIGVVRMWVEAERRWQKK